MKIIIKELNGKTHILDVEQYDTIEDVKIKIQHKINVRVGVQRLMLDSQQLENDRFINDYEINENSTIYLIVRLSGGEFGNSGKIFTDPEKVEPKGLKFSDNAPFYRAVTKGMNLLGICENKNCMAFKKEVIYKFGFGTFDIINDMKNKPPECPSCEFPLREVSTCAFWQCNYSYVGVKYENKQLKDVNYSNSNSKKDEVDYFAPGENGKNNSIWVELKITAKKI